MRRRLASGGATPRTWVRGCLVALAGGCSGTVVPPARPAEPTTVYVCDYGYHSSLLLPVGHDGTWVEYLFGDWDWAALNDTGPWPAVRAAAFSSAATLGRRLVYEPARSPPVPMTTPVREQAVTVDGASCRQLEAELDARWRRGAAAGGVVYAGSSGAFYLYVRDDAEAYSLLHNCNRETADWLDRMGCRTSGLCVLSHFDVKAGG